MENENSEKLVTFKDLMKFSDDILMPVMNKILSKIEGIELELKENRKEHKEMRMEFKENRREHQEMRRDHQGLRKEFEEMRRDILSGQDVLAKLIEDRKESEAMDMATCQRYEEKFEDYGERIRVVEEKVGIIAIKQ